MNADCLVSSDTFQKSPLFLSTVQYEILKVESATLSGNEIGLMAEIVPFSFGFREYQPDVDFIEVRKMVLVSGLRSP